MSDIQDRKEEEFVLKYAFIIYFNKHIFDYYNRTFNGTYTKNVKEDQFWLGLYKASNLSRIWFSNPNKPIGYVNFQHNLISKSC